MTLGQLIAFLPFLMCQRSAWNRPNQNSSNLKAMPFELCHIQHIPQHHDQRGCRQEKVSYQLLYATHCHCLETSHLKLLNHPKIHMEHHPQSLIERAKWEVLQTWYSTTTYSNQNSMVFLSEYIHEPMEQNGEPRSKEWLPQITNLQSIYWLYAHT